jgi:hypothetical protein
MIRFGCGFAVLCVLVVGCNDGRVVEGAAATATPTAEPTATEAPTPTPIATATPVPCNFYAVDSATNLWIIDPVAITTQMVGPTGVAEMTDIAITSANEIIGITFDRAYRIDPATGAATLLAAAPWLFQQNALDALPDGRLLVGGGNALSAVDPVTGVKENVGTMGGGRVFSGDVTAVDATHALGSGKDPLFGGHDHLFGFELAVSSTDEGSLGQPVVYGLDYGCDGELYGVVAQSPPKLVRVDALTAQTTMLGPLVGGPATLWGAAGPAE